MAEVLQQLPEILLVTSVMVGAQYWHRRRRSGGR